MVPQAPLVNATVCLRPDDGDGERDGFVAMLDGVGEVYGAGGGVVEPSPEDLANLIYTSGRRNFDARTIPSLQKTPHNLRTHPIRPRQDTRPLDSRRWTDA